MSREQQPIEEVAPDDFLDTWGASSYSEALEAAERAPTTTPDEELPRCPRCLSQKVKHKSLKAPCSHRKDEDWVCTECNPRNHFEEPVYGDPAEIDAEPGPDGFEWLADDDLEDPPLTRLLRDLDDDALTALAIFLYRPWGHTDADPSYRELGEVLGVSRQWIGERVRAWRDNGEYRHLVADPRPRVAIATSEEVSAE